ncbi:MAG: hypothetical protein HYR92_00535 [Burkholderiales bacterium]|nr:hypothetical protein [Burkholderiales bacterium]
MDWMQFLDMVLHADKMGQLIEQYGTLIYVVLFAIVFCETAFVVFPFLPGDSLLFIAGTFCAAGAMNPWFLIALLLFASISGNTINYWIGSTIGHKVMASNSRWIDKTALELWICSLVLAGFYFGHIPLIKNNLSVIVMIGVGAAIVPILLGLAWKFGRRFFKK